MRLKTNQLRLCALFAVLSMMPTSALAAAFWNLDQGVSSYGRAGANLVQPGDPTAVYLNPAALAGLDGFQLVLGANMIKDFRTFQRVPVEGQGPQDPWDEVKNESDPIPSPNLFLSYNFAGLGLEGLTMGFGLWGPPRADMVFDPEGSQRYSLVKSLNVQAHYALALAYDTGWHKLRFGAAFMGVYMKIDQTLDLNASIACGGQQENQKCDIQTQLDASQPFIPSAIFGMSVELVEGLELALSYQMEFDVSADGVAELTPGRNFEGLVDFEGDEINVALNLPGIARAGLRYTDTKNLYDIELAFVYENWSRNKTIRFDATQINVVSDLLPEAGAVGIIELTPNWRDTYSLRLGGSWEAIPELLTARAGVYYERSAVDDTWVNMGNFDADKIGTTLGARIEIPGGFWADLAFGHVHFFPRTVTNTGTLSDDPIVPNAGDPELGEDGTPEEQWPIADGSYSSRMIVFMAALGFKWDV
jgi:long-chain fatty acid transport protein